MTDLEIDLIRAAYSVVEENVGKAARSVDRQPEDVKIIVVSKSQPVSKIQAAISAGIRVFGENFPEETQEKINWEEMPADVQWHMIGHLQSRKIKIVATHFNLLHSLDSLNLALKLNAYLKTNHQQPYTVLLQFNVGGENSKHGFPAIDDSSLRTSMIDLEQIMEMQYIRVCGVMGMVPLFINSEESRPYHRRLYNIFSHLRELYPKQSWQEISTGTSYDYQVAVQEGATYIRVGQAILGERPRR